MLLHFESIQRWILRKELALWTIEILNRDKAMDLHPTILTKFYYTISKAYKDHSYSLQNIYAIVASFLSKLEGIVACG